MNRNKTLLSVIVVLILFCIDTFSQTSQLGEYEIYSRETSRTGLGYLTLQFNLTESLGDQFIIARGVSFTQNYDVATFVNEALGKNSQFKLFIEGNFNIGVALGEKTLPSSQNIYPSSTLKYYVGTIEAFALYLVPEFSQIIGHGNALTFTFGIALLNLGGTFAYLDGGELEKHSVGTVNIIPFVLKPTIIYDFGTSGIGIQGYINPFNFLSYNYGSSELYPNTNGIKSKNSFFKQYEIRFIFAY